MLENGLLMTSIRIVSLRENQAYREDASMGEPFGILIALAPRHVEAQRAGRLRIGAAATLTNSAAIRQSANRRPFLFQ